MLGLKDAVKSNWEESSQLDCEITVKVKHRMLLTATFCHCLRI